MILEILVNGCLWLLISWVKIKILDVNVYYKCKNLFFKLGKFKCISINNWIFWPQVSIFKIIEGTSEGLLLGYFLPFENNGRCIYIYIHIHIHIHIHLIHHDIVIFCFFLKFGKGFAFMRNKTSNIKNNEIFF